MSSSTNHLPNQNQMRLRIELTTRTLKENPLLCDSETITRVVNEGNESPETQGLRNLVHYPSARFIDLLSLGTRFGQRSRRRVFFVGVVIKKFYAFAGGCRPVRFDGGRSFRCQNSDTSSGQFAEWR